MVEDLAMIERTGRDEVAPRSKKIGCSVVVVHGVFLRLIGGCWE